LAGVIGTVFAVSKISAAVVATIALINTLIKAYNALKASAIVAGVASAFALNPLLGVGAVALAAGVLAGANALAGRSDTDTISTGASGGGFSGTMPNGQPFVTGGGGTGAGGGTTGGTGGGGGFTGGSTGGGVGGGGIVIDPSIAAASKKAQEASANLNAVLDRINGTAGAGFNPGRFRMAEAASSGATYNINVSGAFDRERTAREIVETINDSFYRGTGGANNLQIV
jgi:hypothetical protein